MESVIKFKEDIWDKIKQAHILLQFCDYEINGQLSESELLKKPLREKKVIEREIQNINETIAVEENKFVVIREINQDLTDGLITLMRDAISKRNPSTSPTQEIQEDLKMF